MVHCLRALVLIFSLLSVSACAFLGHEPSPEDGLGTTEAFQRDFNAASDHVRVVAVVSPS